MSRQNRSTRLVPVLIFGALVACQSGLGLQSTEDDRLVTAVKRALVQESKMNLVPVEVDVSRGVVYLTGEVDTAQHKIRAETLTRRVHGVKDVVNKLRVRD